MNKLHQTALEKQRAILSLLVGIPTIVAKELLNGLQNHLNEYSEVVEVTNFDRLPHLNLPLGYGGFMSPPESGSESVGNPQSK